MKNKDRLIAKLVATALITAGVVGVGGGILACRDSVKNSPNPAEDAKYIAGVLSTTLGCSLTSIGTAVYPYKTKEDNSKSL